MENYEDFLEKKKKELQKNVPFENGTWNQEYLYEYLVSYCCIGTEKMVSAYFEQFLDNKDLLKMLFDFLLDDDYDGSDSQIGAVCIIRKMDKYVLKQFEKELLEAQKNEIEWKRPFINENDLKEILNW